jgi:metallophosphoesterase superfamily enzyme
MRVHTDWLLTAERAAIHLPTWTAVVADVHLGYGRARCRRGEAIPGGELDDTIAALAPLLTRPEVHRLAIAGDLVEDAAGRDLIPELLAWLGGCGVELAGIVPGNHDRSLRQPGLSLPLHPDGFTLGDWRVMHGDDRLPRGPVVCGHFHPCLRWAGAAAPCYLVGPRRLVLPALSADAAGVNVLHDRRWRSWRCCVPVGGEVLDFGELGTVKRRFSRDAQRSAGHAPRSAARRG